MLMNKYLKKVGLTKILILIIWLKLNTTKQGSQEFLILNLSILNYLKIITKKDQKKDMQMNMPKLVGIDWEGREEKNLENKKQNLKIENFKELKFLIAITCWILNNLIDKINRFCNVKIRGQIQRKIIGVQFKRF